jgi:hypothetical protein
MCEKRLCLPLLLCSIFIVKTAGAQQLTIDSLTNSLYNSYGVRLYFDALGENAHVYNGYEYSTPDRNIKGSPYYLADSPIPADLLYDGSYYQNIPVLYDMTKDEVVINRLDQNYKISLVNDKLNSFSIRKHEFVRISMDSLNGIQLATGFYDKMYGGKTTVLVKRKRRLQETYIYNTLGYEYLEENIYYLILGGQIVQVEGKSSVMRLFKTKKSEIKAFLRKNKLNFKSDFEKTLVAASAYYDQLTS